MANKTLKPPYKWLLLFVALAAIFIYWYNNTISNPPASNSTQQLIPANANLSFTKHARCRMECRGITEAEIREVLREGFVNHQKSDKNDLPCPSYAIEDRVQDGQLLRVVFGICGDEIKVITCIDLGQKHDCDCL